MHSARFRREAQIQLCVNDLILCLNRLIYARNVPTQSAGEDQDFYHQLTAYIEEHLDEDLSLETLARELYGFKDYSSFYRAFKKEYGISPREYQEKQTIKYDEGQPLK